MKGLGKPLELLLYHFPLVLTITDFLVAGIIIIFFFFYKGTVNWCDVIYEILLKIFYLERKKKLGKLFIFSIKILNFSKIIH